MLKSSSITTESGMAVTVGPPCMAVLPLPTTTMPLLPDSEAPMASVSTRSGKTSKNSSFTEGEKTAAINKAQIDSPRGKFTLSAQRNPTQDFYVREAKGNYNVVTGVAVKALADPGRGCKP